MILKHFLMGFSGIAIVTGIGIGIYYGTNSSEKIRQDAQILKLSDSEGATSDAEKIEPSQKGLLDTEELVSPSGQGS